MSEAIENLQAAQQKAIAIRPKVGGFPYLAETLRRAGVSRNIWTLPACQSVYLTDDGPVVTVGAPLVSPKQMFRRSMVTRLSPPCPPTKPVTAHFPSFLQRHGKPASSAMTSISTRAALHISCNGEEYVEGYPAVEIP